MTKHLMLLADSQGGPEARQQPACPSTFLQSFTLLGVCLHRHGFLSFLSRSTTTSLLKITLQPVSHLTARSGGPMDLRMDTEDTIPK